jgi:hypothetical protein
MNARDTGRGAGAGAREWFAAHRQQELGLEVAPRPVRDHLSSLAARPNNINAAAMAYERAPTGLPTSRQHAGAQR